MNPATRRHNATRTSGRLRSRPKPKTNATARSAAAAPGWVSGVASCQNIPDVLGERIDLPHQRDDPGGGRGGADGHQGQGHAGPVPVVEGLDDQIGREESQHRCPERQEGGGTVDRLGAHEPPERQPAHHRGDSDGQPVAEAHQRDHREQARDHGHAEGVRRVEGAATVDRGREHADHDRGQRGRAGTGNRAGGRGRGGQRVLVELVGGQDAGRRRRGGAALRQVHSELCLR